jgi:lipocalin
MLFTYKKQVSIALALLSTSTSSFLFGSAQEPACPTVETVQDFSLADFVSAPWYVHQQAENAYSPPNRNNCVRAEYEIREEPTSLWGYTVDVHNSARNDNGEDVDAFLCAYQEDDDIASKLRVAPCFLPKWASGPYWVLAHDEDEGYALISGGQPTFPNGDNGCRTGNGVNNSGLWIFTRNPVRDEDLVNNVRQIAQDAGFDVTVLNDVDQEGCYEDGDVPDPTCQDVETTFPVWFGSERDCDWVDNYAWYRCWFYSDHCPETCGECD